MTRRDVLRGAVAFSISAPATIGIVNYDPLLQTIRSYQAGLEDFNENAPRNGTGDALNHYAEGSYGPYLKKLTGWDGPATTKEGAIEALRLALTDDGGVYGCEAADKMIQAALGFLEGMAA
jgi:hypothetical protein